MENDLNKNDGKELLTKKFSPLPIVLGFISAMIAPTWTAFLIIIRPFFSRQTFLSTGPGGFPVASFFYLAAIIFSIFSMIIAIKMRKLLSKKMFILSIFFSLVGLLLSVIIGFFALGSLIAENT